MTVSVLAMPNAECADIAVEFVDARDATDGWTRRGRGGRGQSPCSKRESETAVGGTEVYIIETIQHTPAQANTRSQDPRQPYA